MNRNQINKSRMYFACDLVLDNHQELMSSIPELITTHQLLKEKLVLIRQYRQVQEVDSSGLTQNKNMLRLDLCKFIRQFSGVLKAYATVKKDMVLKAKVSYTSSKLQRSSDPIIYDIGQLLYSLARPFEKELERFFLSKTAFEEMKRLLDEFKNAIPKKRVAKGISMVSTANIFETFKAVDSLLKEEIDSLILPFQFVDTGFYNEYKNARIIIDYSGPSAAPAKEE